MTDSLLEILRKYRFFLLPLGLVVVLDITLLAMNYVISSQLEVSSNHINISGRQRMLSQKMTKDALLIDFQKAGEQADPEIYEDLKNSVTLFDKTLNAFYLGGVTESADGTLVEIEAEQNSAIRETLTAAIVVWQPLRDKLLNIEPQSDISATLVQQLALDNLQLLALMNTLTNQLEFQAKQQTYLLRGLQTIVVMLILLSFSLAIHRLVRREQYFQKLMEKSSDIVLGIDSGTSKITFISSSVKHLLQYDEHYYSGQSFRRLFTEKSAERISHLLLLAKRYKPLPYSRCEVQLIRADNEVIDAEMLLQVTRSEDGRSSELSADIRDISERKQLEKALTVMAHTDSLTGLPNRSQFNDMAEQALHDARMKEQGVAMMFIDLDDFKLVNDEKGHHIGDALLQEIACRMKSNLRTADTVFRIGGDEFVVLIQNMPPPAHIQLVANKLIDSLSEKITIDSHVCQVGASIGVARYPNDGQDIDALLRAADQAMYRVKQSGKNAVAFAA
ncbi:diguanylate cyclase domain-containing protein [Methylophaga sp. OBS3]|uniref:diguanylate cyclase domain-containing protein n=1 Tax=Methylophaga sp. OBS3 TaxID=2991934 RepID=UPI002259B109|nr:diguanylate cyclase [Methylophaga sp. OBS3]MCX4188878.1 diguanylate cyclase [Methylophaga sp. OBS3]